jgi:hypothetical protein
MKKWVPQENSVTTETTDNLHIIIIKVVPKAYGGVDIWIHIFLTSALAGDEWSASHPGRFTPGEIAPNTDWMEGYVDPRAGLGGVEKRKFLTLPGLEPRPLGYQARSQSLYRLRGYVINFT